MQEIQRAKAQGSVVGIYTRGIEWDMPLTHPAFWPIYEEATRQDLPITVHVGNGSSPTIRARRLPKLRVGFLEAGSDWTVRLIKGLRATKGAKIDQWLAERVFVSCALDDDLAYIIGKAGDEFLVMATDFPHGDAFRQDQLAQGLMRRGDLSEKTVEKILRDNRQRLFHF